jgi:hypothetical protein
LQLNGFIQLVDAADNSPGAGAETLYVDSLIVSSGASLDLNGRKLYARAVELQGTGTIIGGTATIVPDGGPILYALPTSGKISVSGEQDNWTFFGRANQTVSVVMNPSGPTTPGSPAPINPVLGQGRLTLLSPTAELGSVQGGVSTLADITLPVDGTYTLRMRAPLTDPTRTGVYNLALYNVTVETRPLLLNAITAGNIETPFSRNRWTFSLDAGQQIQFDLIAAVTSGLQFTLEGPDGFVAFNNITDDSTLITVPGGKTGNYVLTAKGQTDQTGAYGFIIRDGSITPLTLGTPFAGVLPGSGSPRWFKATLPNVGQLLVTLDDSNNNDRTRSTCGMANCRCATSSSSAFQGYAADGQIYVPNAVAGDWYILVYGDHVPAPSSYTLKAEYSDLRITSITPDRYGVNNTMTMTLSGGGFEPGTSVKLISGATAINTTSIEINSFTQITATFNLTGAPQAMFDVRVEKGPLNFTLPGGFRTLPNAPAHLEMKLNMPGVPTRTSVTSFSVEYANTGNVAMPAPLMIVQSADPEGDEHPILSLDLTRTFETFWATTLPHGTSERVMMLGSGAVPGVLNPGERMRIPINYLGEKPPFETTDALLQLELKCVEESEGKSAGPFPWEALKNNLKPPTVPDAIGDQAYSDITYPLGTVQAYASMLIANARYLGRLGLRVTDIDELWDFEVQY